MSKKKRGETETTEFEVDGIEEAYAPALPQRPVRPWAPEELPRLQVETPPELQDPPGAGVKTWIVDRRDDGLLAWLKRWLTGKTLR
jgi:hypothetical protein